MNIYYVLTFAIAVFSIVIGTLIGIQGRWVGIAGIGVMVIGVVGSIVFTALGRWFRV